MRLFGVILIGLMCSTTSAQNRRFQSGLILNANGIHVEGNSSLYWDEGNGKTWGGGGMSYGIFSSHSLGENLVGCLELRYTRKGGLFEFVNSYGQQDFEVLKLRYIEIPLLIGYKGKSSNRTFLIETGLSYSRLTNSEILFNDFTERPTRPNAENFIDHDISVNGAIKTHISKNQKIILGMRFSRSIRSIHQTYKLYNLVYGIELNYMIFNNRT